MIDDVEDKARRNLVAVSSAILLSAWLEIPFSAFVGKLVDPGRLVFDNYRLWSAGLIVLLYLAIRSSFSEQGGNYRKEIKEEFRLKAMVETQTMTEPQANRYTRTGAESSIFDGKLADFISSHLEENPETAKYKTWGRPTLSLSMQDYRDPWNFDMRVAFVWELDTLKQSTSTNSLLKVRVKGFQRARIATWVWFKTTFYSKSSINYLIPVVLTLAAEVLLCCKIFLALWPAIF